MSIFSIKELMAEADKVHLIYEIAGTHEVESLGLPPSHNRIEHIASSLITIQDGKVVEQYDFYDWLDFLQQLDAASEELRPGGKEWPGGAKLHSRR